MMCGPIPPLNEEKQLGKRKSKTGRLPSAAHEGDVDIISVLGINARRPGAHSLAIVPMSGEKGFSESTQGLVPRRPPPPAARTRGVLANLRSQRCKSVLAHMRAGTKSACSRPAGRSSPRSSSAMCAPRSAGGEGGVEVLVPC